MGRKKNGICDEESEVYHNVITLFKIYRSVSWRMQVQIGQVKHRFQKEYGTDVDEFLDSIYQAGMDLKDDDANIRARSITGCRIIPICRPISPLM